jgi:hypothetical protein
MLLQSRGSRVSDVLTLKDVDEIADSPPGVVQDAVSRKIREELKEIASSPTTSGSTAAPQSPIASSPALASASAQTLPTPEATKPASDATETIHATIKDGKAEFDNKI